MTRERAHVSGPDRWWAESWSFDTVTALGALRVDVVTLPNQRRAWYSACLVAADRPYVLCRDDELAWSASTWPIELRGSGLWMHAICETPMRHWTVAMEAFALAFDDPAEAWGAELGDRVGLAFDLEWEHDDPDDVVDGYSAACRVSGDLQLDDERVDVDASGSRSHRWGELDAVLVSGALLAGSDAPMLATTSTGRRRLLRRWTPASGWSSAFVD